MPENEGPTETTSSSNSSQEPESKYPALLEYLETKEGHELASRLIALFEAIQRATIESAADQRKKEIEFQHKTAEFQNQTTRLWLWLQAGAITTIIVTAAALAWHGKLDATVATLMATLFGYFLGRPIR